MPLLSQTEMQKSFERLNRETINISSGWQMEHSRAFIEFKKAFGKTSVPYLLQELGSRPSQVAIKMLESVTGENPVPSRISGNTSEAAKAWVKWGLRNKGRL